MKFTPPRIPRSIELALECAALALRLALRFFQ